MGQKTQIVIKKDDKIYTFYNGWGAGRPLLAATADLLKNEDLLKSFDLEKIKDFLEKHHFDYIGNVPAVYCDNDDGFAFIDADNLKVSFAMRKYNEETKKCGIRTLSPENLARDYYGYMLSNAKEEGLSEKEFKEWLNEKLSIIEKRFDFVNKYTFSYPKEIDYFKNELKEIGVLPVLEEDKVVSFFKDKNLKAKILRILNTCDNSFFDESSLKEAEKILNSFKEEIKEATKERLKNLSLKVKDFKKIRHNGQIDFEIDTDVIFKNDVIEKIKIDAKDFPYAGKLIKTEFKYIDAKDIFLNKLPAFADEIIRDYFYNADFKEINKKNIEKKLNESLKEGINNDKKLLNLLKDFGYGLFRSDAKNLIQNEEPIRYEYVNLIYLNVNEKAERDSFDTYVTKNVDFKVSFDNFSPDFNVFIKGQYIKEENSREITNEDTVIDEIEIEGSFNGNKEFLAKELIENLKESFSFADEFTPSVKLEREINRSDKTIETFKNVISSKKQSPQLKKDKKTSLKV